MFKRKIYDKLLEWKNESDGKTALLIEGARRIGKSRLTNFIRIGGKNNEKIKVPDTFKIRARYEIKLFLWSL